MDTLNEGRFRVRLFGSGVVDSYFDLMLKVEWSEKLWPEFVTVSPQPADARRFNCTRPAVGPNASVVIEGGDGAYLRGTVVCTSYFDPDTERHESAFFVRLEPYGKDPFGIRFGDRCGWLAGLTG